MNYYPLKRVRDKLSPEDAQMVATPTAKKGWSYLFADKDGEWLRVESDAHHHLTSITYTPKFRSLWISLKIHKKKWYKVCRYNGHAS